MGVLLGVVLVGGLYLANLAQDDPAGPVAVVDYRRPQVQVPPVSHPAPSSVPRTDSGIASLMADRTDPIVRDLNEDLVCSPQIIGVSAHGTLTNRGDEPATYMIKVTFHDAQHVRFAEGMDIASTVRVGETIAWEASSFASSIPESWYCEVVAVNRRS